MYMNFWYPVVRSEDLGKTPQKVRILAHDFVVFRDEQGKPAVLSDTCIHRGASLAAGTQVRRCNMSPMLRRDRVLIAVNPRRHPRACNPFGPVLAGEPR